MNHHRVKVFSKWAILSAVILLLVCPQSGWGQKNERVTLKWSWLYTPNLAPVILGMEKGIFKSEGIDLELPDGRGSVKNLQFLSTKKVLVAFVDLGTAARFISKDTPVKAVYCYFQSSPMAIVYRADLGISKPKDLEGKKFAFVPGSATEAVWPAFAKLNGVDVSKVQVVTVTGAARMTAILNRDAGFAAAYFPDSVPILRSRGAKIGFFKYSDYGVNLLSQGIAVHSSFPKEKPETLRRLLRGISRSVLASIGNPEAAIAALKKAAPLTVKNPKVALEVLGNALTLLHTENTKSKPLGWMARADWKQTIDLLKEYGGLKKPLPIGEYYTNEFVTAVPVK